MEFKGTKGRWEAVNRGKHWNNQDIDNIQIQYGEDGECVSDHVYCEYDALLISKAPEMLEMLIKCTDALNKTTEYDVLERYQKLVDDANKLITEATTL